MRQRRQAVIAERKLLHLAIGGVLLDPVAVLAGAPPQVQDRWVAVGLSGQFVQPVTGQRAQAVEMRRQVRCEVGRQIQRGEPGERSGRRGTG